MIKSEIVYFKEGGAEHTDLTLDLSLKAAKDLGIGKIVVASNTGETGVKAAEALRGVVCLGSDVLTNSIRMRQKLGHSHLSYITSTLISMKVKVNVEIVAKATDAGLLEPGERVISVAGSHMGADTAVAFTADETSNVLAIRPLQYIVMPLSRKKADEEYMAKRRAAQSS